MSENTAMIAQDKLLSEAAYLAGLLAQANGLRETARQHYFESLRYWPENTQAQHELERLRAQRT